MRAVHGLFDDHETVLLPHNGADDGDDGDAVLLRCSLPPVAANAVTPKGAFRNSASHSLSLSFRGSGPLPSSLKFVHSALFFLLSLAASASFLLFSLLTSATPLLLVNLADSSFLLLCLFPSFFSSSFSHAFDRTNV